MSVKRAMMVGALALALISVWTGLVGAIAPGWLTSGVKEFALVILPAAAMASVLVLYFDWRSRFRDGITERDRARKAA